MQYIFEGAFEVLADSKKECTAENAENYRLVMGGSIHSILPDEKINWAFTRTNRRINRITKV